MEARMPLEGHTHLRKKGCNVYKGACLVVTWLIKHITCPLPSPQVWDMRFCWGKNVHSLTNTDNVKNHTFKVQYKVSLSI